MSSFYPYLNKLRSADDKMQVVEEYLNYLLGQISNATPSNMIRLVKDLDRDWRSFAKRAGQLMYNGELVTLTNESFRQSLAQLPEVEGSPDANEMFKLLFEELGWDWEASYRPITTQTEFVAEITAK
jgi:hypothetical protein